MTFPDVIDLGLSNLRQARLRTLLTTLGVSIGVSALVGMVSLGQGLQDNLNARLLKTGFFQTMMVFPRFGGGPDGGASQTPKILDETAMLAIRQIPGVRRVEPDIRLFLNIEAGEKKAQAQAVAVPAEAADETVFKEMPIGKFFSSEDANEVILNTEMAKNLGFTPPSAIIGKTVKATIGLGRGFGGPPNQPAAKRSRGATKVETPSPPGLPTFEVEVKVVGLTERERAVFGNVGSQIYIPFKMAQENQKKFFEKFPFLAMLRPPGFTGATVHLKSARELESVEKTISGMGFRTISIASAISQLKRVFLVVDMLLGFVGSIGLAVASLGIMNTMVMAVLERTREIGVMKAVGAEDQDIRFLFLAESAVIGFTGGVIGLIFAWALGRTINFGANIYFVQQGFQKENLFSIPLWLIGVAMVFSVLVSVASGLYPADRAARIDPTRALRHD